MAYQRRTGGGGGPKRRFSRRKGCRFCGDKDLVINYKVLENLRPFLSERGKIVPRRISGNCAKHQRKLTTAIKQARNIALISFASSHSKVD
ncbi:MAG: 30S ribosomal protein S18 [Desulfuromonas sp.]|nr:MAG: 30S ribosomal protein S18 [Desulfuromonas sp.]